MFNLVHSAVVGRSANLAEDVRLMLRAQRVPTRLFHIGNVPDPAQLFQPHSVVVFLLHSDKIGELPDEAAAFFSQLVASPQLFSESYRRWNYLHKSVLAFGLGSRNYSVFNGGLVKALCALRRDLGLEVYDDIGFGDNTADFAVYSSFDPWLKRVQQNYLPQVAKHFAPDPEPARVSAARFYLGERVFVHAQFRVGWLASRRALVADDSVCLYKLLTNATYRPGDALMILPKVGFLDLLAEKLPFAAADRALLRQLHAEREAGARGSAQRVAHELLALLERKLGRAFAAAERSELLAVAASGIDVFAVPSREWLSGLADFVADALRRERLRFMTASSAEALELYFDYVVAAFRGRIDVIADFFIGDAPDSAAAFRCLHFVLRSTPLLQPRAYSIASSPLKRWLGAALGVPGRCAASRALSRPGAFMEIMVRNGEFVSANLKQRPLTTSFLTALAAQPERWFQFFVRRRIDLSPFYESPGPHLLVATGSGLGLARAVVEHAFFRARRRVDNLVLLYGTRYCCHLDDELKQMLAHLVIGYSTRGATGFQMYVQQAGVGALRASAGKPYIAECLARAAPLLRGALGAQSHCLIIGRSAPVPAQVLGFLKAEVPAFDLARVVPSLWR